jgi:nucleoside 2-deoxyribosyltransferase
MTGITVETIAICGSARHREAIYEAGRLLDEAGFLVLSPPLHQIDRLCAGQPLETRELAWKGATFAHFNRIMKADAILIVNPDGYVGSSTTLELGYAVALGKLVIAMSGDRDEMARGVLFDLVLDCSDITKAVTELTIRLGAGAT